MREKEEISILIIEDEESQVQIMQDALEDFNEESSKYIIRVEVVASFSNALNMLLTKDFDVAIIDLNLNQRGVVPEELDGNKLVDIIRRKIRLPIIIRTGYPTQFIAENIDGNNNFLKIYAKDEPVEKLLEDVVHWYNSRIGRTLGMKGVLEHYLNDLFWIQISQNLNEWEKGNIDSGEQEKSLLRYTLNVLQDCLEVDIETGSFEPFHPAEVYIKPPIKAEYFFGDILKNESDDYFMILTPACEMAQGKCEKILLAQIRNYNEIEKFVEAKDGYFNNRLSSKKKQSLEQWFRNGHKNSLGYHFLPSYTDFPGGFIDFQAIFSEKFSAFEMERTATVTSQFAKDISSRFTSYYARQGQPDLNSDLIIRGFSNQVEQRSQ